MSSVNLNGTENYVTNVYTVVCDESCLYEYDEVETTNANGESVTLRKDKRGNVLSKTYSDGRTLVYDYTFDKGDQLKSVTESKNGSEVRVFGYTYDGLDKVLTYTEKENGTTKVTETYTYDEYGNVQTATQSTGMSYGYTYKTDSTRALESVVVNGVTFKPQTDVLGRNKGKQIHVNNAKIAEENIVYRKVGDHATNMPATIRFGNKVGERFALVDSLRYAYDVMGNIEKVYENGELAIRYQYDALNRLIREDNKVMNKTVLFAYDNNGNILKQRKFTFTLKNAIDIEELDSEDKVYIYDGDKLLAFNGEGCAYNETTNVQTTYRNKPLGWTNRRVTSYNGVQFSYDGQGRRIAKGDISYIYDSQGRLLKQSNDLEFFYDHSGVSSVKHGENTYFYRKDILGNVIALLDTSGAVVVKYTYDAWGNNVVSNANNVIITDANHIGNLNPFRYRGYYYDGDTKLYYLKTRYYDPETGRFISQDGIEYLDSDTINGLNLYAYCGNNPVSNVDPNGNAWWHWLAGALAVVGVALVVAAITVLTAGVGTTVMVGTLAGAVIHGAAVGALIGAGVGVVAGGIIGGAVSGWTAEGILTGMGIGFGVGAIAGAIIGGTVGGIHYGWQQGVLSKAGSYSVSGEKTELHHIVEQCQQGKSGFARDLIRNSNNEIRITKSLHKEISKFYSSNYMETGLRYRDYLAVKNYSFGKQYNLGIKAISTILKMLL